MNDTPVSDAKLVLKEGVAHCSRCDSTDIYFCATWQILHRPEVSKDGQLQFGSSYAAVLMREPGETCVMCDSCQDDLDATGIDIAVDGRINNAELNGIRDVKSPDGILPYPSYSWWLRQGCPSSVDG